jgi:hypothetical protein
VDPIQDLTGLLKTNGTDIRHNGEGKSPMTEGVNHHPTVVGDVQQRPAIPYLLARASKSMTRLRDL